MKIESLLIRNFRGIKSASLIDLQGMVVIAGQNGSGKSCVLDAIRLLKSVYGGYQLNEWHHWMGEFQINFTNRNDLVMLMNDQTSELRIRCEVSLHSEEREYIRLHAEELIRQSVWRTKYPETYAWSTFRAISLAGHLREKETEVISETQRLLPILEQELAQQRIVGEFSLTSGQSPVVAPSKTLEIVFGTFKPHHIGVIDYHGPHRTYSRETLQGINLNLDAAEQQRSAHALYNYANKYANVKSEMAGSYIKEMLAGAAGSKSGETQSLSMTLKELFKAFFPDKEFLGPLPTESGTLSFPVRTGTNAVHDLNELSAGEKEVLYGYLRLRNSAPKFSVILLDEPELHLNPRLIRALPAFYHKHLGTALHNQIWLITHSDALLREAVGHDGYSVFHMQPATESRDDQVRQLHAKEGLQKAVVDLVGDLAAYRPDAKLVIFEGEGADFDERMTNTLFPTFQQTVNTISAGNKKRVRGLHEILASALTKGQIPLKVFSIVDSDSDEAAVASAHALQWDAYHIENYLLESRFILKVVQDIQVDKFKSEEDVYTALRQCAQESMMGLVRHQLTVQINAQLLACLDLSIDPAGNNPSQLLSAAVSRSTSRIAKAVASDLSPDGLAHHESRLRAEYEKALAADTWRKKFRGRDILRRFVETLNGKLNYETFRNLLVAAMRDAKYQPEGMRNVVETILSADHP